MGKTPCGFDHNVVSRIDADCSCPGGDRDGFGEEKMEKEGNEAQELLEKLRQEVGETPEKHKDTPLGEQFQRMESLVDEIDAVLDQPTKEYGVVQYMIPIRVLEELVDNDSQTMNEEQVGEEVYRELVRKYERGETIVVVEVARWKEQA